MAFAVGGRIKTAARAKAGIAAITPIKRGDLMDGDIGHLLQILCPLITTAPGLGQFLDGEGVFL
jgi:hypothetical protein